MSYGLLRDIIRLKRRPLGLLALLVLADLALMLFLSYWQEPELARAQNDWFAKRQAAAQGVDRGVTARYRDAERDLAEFQKRLIAKKDFPAFLSELYGIARSDSLQLKGITFKPTLIKEEGLVSYHIGFDLSGKYAGAKSFVADLARFPKLVTVDSVSLGSTSPTEESVNLKVQLTVFLKPEGA